MSVSRICVRQVDTAMPFESVHAISQRMHQRAVGCLVVVNEVKEPVGIVTDRDLMSRVLAKGLGPAETKVRDVMTSQVQALLENSAIESALALMRSGRFRRVPVVDRNGKLVGLVTLDDVLRLLSEEFAEVGKLLEKETPRAVVLG